MVSRFSIYTITLIGFLCLTSCKSSKSDLDIINGLYSDDGIFQVNLLLYFNEDDSIGICSSSIISSNKILTSAHCLIPNKKNFVVLYSIEHEDGTVSDHMQYALSYKIHDRYDYNNRSTYKYDLAVLTFPEGSFDGIAPLGLVNSTLKEKTPVFLVGYGCFTTKEKIQVVTQMDTVQTMYKVVCRDQLNLETELNRRVGTNTIAKLTDCPPGMIQINQTKVQVDTSIKKPTGKDVALAPGDSGGPLLTSTGNIVGVASYMDFILQKNRFACYVDLSLSENRQFITDQIRAAQNLQIPIRPRVPLEPEPPVVSPSSNY